MWKKFKFVSNILTIPVSCWYGYQLFMVFPMNWGEFFSSPGVNFAIFATSMSIFVVLNIHYAIEFQKFLKRKKEAKEAVKVAAHEQTVSEIKEILDLDAHYRERTYLDHVQRGRLTVLVAKFDELGVAPPFDKMPYEMYFGRLLPYVEEYGLDRAKQEIRNWYAKNARILLDAKKNKDGS